MQMKQINGYSAVKVFSATKAHDRDRLGDSMTEWLTSHPRFEVVDTVTQQSSDNAFHCLTVIVFLKVREMASGAKAA